MKKLLILIIISFGFNTIKGQTYISPMIGYDFTDMKTSKDDLSLYNLYNDKPFVINSLTFGIKLKQKINSKFNIIIQSNYSRKFAEGWILVEDPPNEGIRFNYFQNSLSLYYNYKSYFCAVGGNINSITNLKIIDNTKPLFNQISEQGVKFIFGKNFGKFSIETYFYKGLTSNLNRKNKILLLPISSLGLSLSYDIKVINSFKKKTKAECPKF